MSETIEKIGIPNTLKAKTAFLENKLQNIEDEQGIFGKMWNGTKELTGIGTYQKECETLLKKFEKGDITFEEAVEYLNGFEQKQEKVIAKIRANSESIKRDRRIKEIILSFEREKEILNNEEAAKMAREVPSDEKLRTMNDVDKVAERCFPLCMNNFVRKRYLLMLSDQ